MDDHIKLRSTDLKNIKVEWSPAMIVYSDGAGRIIMFFFIITIGFLIYFIPSFAAYSNKRSKDAIVALNLLGGWTGLLWLVSLIWAMSKDAPVAEVKIENTNTNIGTSLEKLLSLKEKEYLQKSSSILARMVSCKILVMHLKKYQRKIIFL